MVANGGQALSQSTETDATIGSDGAASADVTVKSPLSAAPHAMPSLEGISPRDPKLAAYIGQMTTEMSAMARAAGFDLLAYFLDMARIEANIQSGKEG